MISIKLLENKYELERAVGRARLWIAEKEMNAYSDWLAKAEPSEKRTARDKVIDMLKSGDPEWQEREKMIVAGDVMLNLINSMISALVSTLRAIGNPESNVTLELFELQQDSYIELMEKILASNK